VGYTNLKDTYIMTKDDQLAVLGTLDKLPLNEAKTKALEILATFPTKTVRQTAAVNRLIYDIKNANTSKYVCKSMWGPFLSNEGLGVTGSAWKSHYNGI
jgi:hypothetical protein